MAELTVLDEKLAEVLVSRRADLAVVVVPSWLSAMHGIRSS